MGATKVKASVWIHKAGEEPRKIIECKSVTFKTTLEGPVHQLTERPAVEYAPGVTGPYQITFNVKTASEVDYLPFQVGPEVGDGCVAGCKPFSDGWAHHKTCPRVASMDTTCRCSFPGPEDHDCMTWEVKKDEISSTCPASDPTASETPPSS